MNVLVIGSGGREHALAWKAAQSADVDKGICCPGQCRYSCIEPNIENTLIVKVNDFQGLAEFAAGNHVGLTIVGPEQPLVEGM